ncbi:MAG: hypothetical protein EZS28_042881 [Streblomastix strix]|uniref:Uncharacterized protein n=1 Tax=Streblomastix strix TaxID=222440 RepID=A0A5J4TUG9_9EUKA|nr:MAG: hypothetical protein EZS28_042881 [Streblomastix strix]
MGTRSNPMSWQVDQTPCFISCVMRSLESFKHNLDLSCDNRSPLSQLNLATTSLFNVYSLYGANFPP